MRKLDVKTLAKALATPDQSLDAHDLPKLNHNTKGMWATAKKRLPSMSTGYKIPIRGPNPTRTEEIDSEKGCALPPQLHCSDNSSLEDMRSAMQGGHNQKGAYQMRR